MPSEIILCIDMQRYYMKYCMGDFYVACRKINLFRDEARTRGLSNWMVYYDEDRLLPDVLLTSDTETDYRIECLFAFDGAARGGWGKVRFTAETPIVFKQFASAFSNYKLLPALKRHGVTKIYMLGYDLKACVPATAVDAIEHGFEVAIIRNLSYTGNPNPLVNGDFEKCFDDYVARKIGGLRRPDAFRLFHTVCKMKVEDHPYYQALRKIEVIDSRDVLAALPVVSALPPWAIRLPALNI